MRNVLVTGGTGFLGSNLALALLREGCNVRILRRPDSDLRAIGKADVEHCIGDVRDIQSVRRAVKGCDTVFHTAALVSYWRKKREEMYEVNIGGTRNVVDASIESGVRRLVHTSSVAAIGYQENGKPADESNVFNWDKHDVGYRISKHRAEQEILRGVGLGLDSVILNPSVIIGPRDIHFHGGQIVRDVYKKRIFYYPAGGMNVVYVGDVVSGHLAAARKGRVGERYILGGENLTHKEIFRITAELVRGIPPLLKLPSTAAKAIAWAVEGISDFMGIRPWVTRELIVGIGLYNWYSSEKANRELGYTSTPLREAIATTFEWYRENGFL